MKDKKGVQFVMTTVIGGLLFLVPVVFLVFILGKAVGFMMIIAEPMAEFLPIDTVGGVALANLIAILGVILISFLAGLVARNTLASGFVKNLESKVLMKIPGYTVIRGIKSGFDKEDTAQFKPVALALGTAERIGFEIQKLPDGRSMVFIPSVPNTLSGITQILPPDQITYLDAQFPEIMELVERYGFGVGALLEKKMVSPPAPGPSDQSLDEDESPDE